MSRLINVQAPTEEQALEVAEREHGDEHDEFTVLGCTIMGPDEPAIYKIKAE